MGNVLTKAPLSNPPPSGGGQGGGASRGGVTRHASPKILSNAKALRKNMTDAEKLLWAHLRARRFAAYKFRRQHAIDTYIVDFVCLNSQLVIELDGGQHADNAVYDKTRTAFLESMGFEIMRFWNHDMLQNPEGVLSVILERLSNRREALSLTLSLKGEGIIVEHI